MAIASTNPPNLSADATKTRFTLDEYRAIEETAEERHEYCNGEIVVMSGGSEAHSTIACNLLIYFGFLLRDTDFRLYNSQEISLNSQFLRIFIGEPNGTIYRAIL